MFNIGGGEFLVIALIALIVLGPQRLPDAARQVGKALGELRRLSTGFQNELKDAFSDPDLSSTPAPRRHALSALAEVASADAGERGPAAAKDITSTTVTSAVAAVSQQPVARRAPLTAAPAKKAPRKASSPPTTAAQPTAPAKKAPPARKAASAKPAPGAKAPRLPSGG